jgi:hypothetical protein
MLGYFQLMWSRKGDVCNFNVRCLQFVTTMRLTIMGQMVKGMTAELESNNKSPETAPCWPTWKNTWKE